MRPLLLALLAALALTAEALTPEQQRQHEAWLEAMRQSGEVGKPTAAPVRPVDPKSTPEYQAREAQQRAEEAERLRLEQERLRAEREARERAAEEARAKREAQAIADWNERQRQRSEEEQRARERQAEREQQRAAAEQQERAERASRERWRTFWTIIASVVALGVLLLPSIIAYMRGSPQRPAVAGLVVCALLSAIAGSQLPAMTPAPALLWSAALALSLWRFRV